MKIAQIKAYLAVIRTGSVRGAAAQLCLTQSTVAKAVSRLESDLGTPLFDRTAAGLRLNAAGQSLLPYAETIVANADCAASAVAAAVTGRMSVLRASVTPTLEPEVLAAAMRRFRSRHPSVKVVFSTGFLSDCLPKLLTDKLDLSLVMTSSYQAKELSGLTEEPLFEVDQGVVAAPEHRLFAPGADVREVFASSEWLSTVQDEEFLIAELARFGVPAPKSLTLCDFFAINALKGRSEALSLSPLSVVEDARYRGRLAALDPERFPLPPLTISFFHRKGVELPAPADWLRASIREAFRQWHAAGAHRWVRPISD